MVIFTELITELIEADFENDRRSVAFVRRVKTEICAMIVTLHNDVTLHSRLGLGVIEGHLK